MDAALSLRYVFGFCFEGDVSGIIRHVHLGLALSNVTICGCSCARGSCVPLSHFSAMRLSLISPLFAMGFLDFPTSS